MLRYQGPASYASRGMLVGSAFRYGGGNFDPTALWSLWDSFGIENSTMVELRNTVLFSPNFRTN
jgi:hypothetical protein